MRRLRSLAAFAGAAILLSAVPARGAHIDPSFGRSVRRAPAPASAVTALSILPAEGRAELVISVSGPVTVQDFTIPSPHRIVLDVAGARLAKMARPYDGVARGGITNVRLSQYRPNVVRIVLDVDAPRDYAVVRGTNDIRVSVVAAEHFAAWNSESRVASSSGATPSAARPATDEPRDPVLDMATPVAPVETRPVTSTSDVGLSIGSVAAAPPLLRVTVPPPLFAQQSQQPRISVVYQDAEIRDVLAAFAAFSGRTIVVGKDVKGTVTAEIKDQPWDVALKALLEAQGLAAAEESTGIITVDSYQNILEKQSSEPLTTQMVSINYVSAGSLVETVKGLLSRDCASGAASSAAPTQPSASAAAVCITRGSIAADSGTNSLLVTEVTSRLPALLQYVKQLDVRTPQVALKAKIISVSRTQIEQLGVSYDLGSSSSYFNTLLPRNKPGSESSVDDREGRVSLGGDALAGVANASRKYKNGSALNLLFSTALGNYSLTSFIDALREQQLSDIQAEPSIVTLDNREARILVGQETPVRVIDAGAAAQIGQPVRANVQFKETGIILTVTPHITSNRQIRMDLQAEQSELRIIGGDLGFTIDKRNAKTQLLVGDGETAVIGGLTQTQITKNKSGIPILSDLPLLGRLFSQYDNREIKSDLLILITPHIIDEGEAIRPPGSSEK